MSFSVFRTFFSFRLRRFMSFWWRRRPWVPEQCVCVCVCEGSVKKKNKKKNSSLTLTSVERLQQRRALFLVHPKRFEVALVSLLAKTCQQHLSLPQIQSGCIFFLNFLRCANNYVLSFRSELAVLLPTPCTLQSRHSKILQR